MAEEWEKIKEFVTTNAGLFEEMYSAYDYRKVKEFMSSTNTPESLKARLEKLSTMANEIYQLASDIEDLADDAVGTEL